MIEIIRKIKTMSNEEVKKDFLKILYSSKYGVTDLVQYLEDNKFFEQPASTKYHLAEPYGLARHSLAVYYVFKELNLNNKIDFDLPIVALMHDICKLDNYIFNENTNTYGYNKNNTEGHSKKSINILSNFIKLTSKEQECIKYHMGIYSTDAFEILKPYCKREYGFADLVESFNDNTVKMFHFADNLASIYGL